MHSRLQPPPIFPTETFNYTHFFALHLYLHLYTHACTRLFIGGLLGREASLDPFPDGRTYAVD